jgi:hypothetical protein
MMREGTRTVRWLVVIGASALLAGYFVFTKKAYVVGACCLAPLLVFCITTTLRRRRARKELQEKGLLDADGRWTGRKKWRPKSESQP